MKWKYIKGYGNGKTGKINGVILFKTHWDGLLDRNDTTTPRIILNAYLPGFKNEMGRFAVQEDAEKRSDEIWELWLKKMNLQKAV